MSAAEAVTERVVLVRIADERFAIGAGLVEEAVEDAVFTALPNLAEHSPGMLRHRGAWLPAVNPAPLLGLERAAAGVPRSAVIARRGRVRFALAVDALLGVVERPRVVNRPALAGEAPGSTADEELLLEDEEGVITLLRPDALFHGELPEDAEESRMSNAKPSAAPVPIVAFRLGDDEFGADVQQVHEVIPFQPPRPVPHAPEFVEGVIDVRGSIVPVVDLRKRFELPAAAPTAETRVLLVALEQDRIGLVVDAVTEVIRVPADEIAEPPSFFRGLAARYLGGLARIRSGLLILLRLDRILTSEERIALLGIDAGEEAATPSSGGAGEAARTGRKRTRRRTE